MGMTGPSFSTFTTVSPSLLMKLVLRTSYLTSNSQMNLIELELIKIIFYVDRKCTVNLLYFNGGTLLGCQVMHSFDVIGHKMRGYQDSRQF